MSNTDTGIIFDASGNPATLRDDATYTVDARTPDGSQMIEDGVLAWQVRQAFERAPGAGVTLVRIIEDAPLDYAGMVRTFKGGAL